MDGEELTIKKKAHEMVETVAKPPWDSEEEVAENGLAEGFSGDLQSNGSDIMPSAGAPNAPKSRLDQIKESHFLLRQFSPKELKILLNLKRNTSPKAWTLREDLIVLTLSMSNREIADLLQDRNKEAVKKRLQLLRSKGLTKRQGAENSSQ